MSIRRSTAVSLASAVLQMAVTLVTVPIYLRVIGFERYGVIVVVWLLSDYFVLFNIGLDRGVTNMVARFGRSPADKGAIVWTASALGLGSGIFGGVLMGVVLYPVLISVMGVPAGLVGEAGASVYWVTLLVPVSVSGTILAGLLQAENRFVELGLAQLLQAVVFQLLPVTAAVALGASLEVVLIAGAIARATLPLMLLCFVLRRLRGSPAGWSVDWARRLMRYGLWAMVTSVLSPLIVNLDRFLISAQLGPWAVGSYSVPLNLVLRIQLLPAALQSVLFPRLSQADAAERLRLSRRATITLGVLLAPGFVVGGLLLDPFLRLWIGPDADPLLAHIGQVLLIGVWFNSLAYIPFASLQAYGRPDAVARLHLLEAVPFVIVLWLGLHTIGVIGAAVTWSLRAVADAALMFHVAGMSEVLWRALLFPLLVIAVAASLAWGVVPIVSGWALVPAGAVLLAALAVWGWHAAPLPARGLFERWLPMR